MFRFSWIGFTLARKVSAPRKRRRPSWLPEELEERILLSAYTPAQICQAYGVNQIQFNGVKGDGTGQTIAIVDAYGSPPINADLAAFDAMYGFKNTDGKGNPVLTVATPGGAPGSNSLWAEETTLDVEWAHAIAPGAHILLVEAPDNAMLNLLSAVDYARNAAGVSVVSMSWGAGEFSSETAYDYHFVTPSGHIGVTFIASSGDSGAVPVWPAVSPNVVSVGGTSLVPADASGTYGSETGWSGTGGGISLYESKPSYQSWVTQSSTMRTGPDVTMVADPGTGVYIVFNGSLTVVGGTSAGAPIWSGIVAIADQGRTLNGQSSLDGRSQTLPALYSMSAANFHDVTSGSTSNGSSTLTAGAGYDLVSGRGSPYANLVVAGLVSYSGGGSSGGSTGGSTGGTTGTGGSGSHKGKHSSAPKFDNGPLMDTSLDSLAAEASLFNAPFADGLFSSLVADNSIVPSPSDSNLGTVWDRPLPPSQVARHG